jgi:hypothetical protein
MGLIVCPKTLVLNQPTLHNNPEDGRIQVNHSRSLRSHRVIPTGKYTDDVVLPAKEETVLWGMIDRLTEIGRCSGM